MIITSTAFPTLTLHASNGSTHSEVLDFTIVCCDLLKPNHPRVSIFIIVDQLHVGEYIIRHRSRLPGIIDLVCHPKS